MNDLAYLAEALIVIGWIALAVSIVLKARAGVSWRLLLHRAGWMTAGCMIGIIFFVFKQIPRDIAIPAMMFCVLASHIRRIRLRRSPARHATSGRQMG
jgi:uncharacterized membrane protein YfcA